MRTTGITSSGSVSYLRTPADTQQSAYPRRRRTDRDPNWICAGAILLDLTLIGLGVYELAKWLAKVL